MTNFRIHFRDFLAALFEVIGNPLVLLALALAGVAVVYRWLP